MSCKTILMGYKECQKSVKECQSLAKYDGNSCYLRVDMIRSAIIKLWIVFLLVITAACSTKEDDFTERTKIALRDVGNHLLLSNKDSTSLILPIKELESSVYELTFNNSLYFEPTALVSIIERSFKSAQLPEDYRVEVIQCTDREVAYSYQMTQEAESTIIPCSGRYLPNACYEIQVKFITIKQASQPYYILLASFFIIGFGFLMMKKMKPTISGPTNENAEKLGSFYFYPQQNKLVKQAEEIALSKKECEILTLLVERPNEVIQRDELTKRVWEDNGVFVGRSLDTYISKLRKKLKDDPTIKLTNVHGVGYKLEVL